MTAGGGHDIADVAIRSLHLGNADAVARIEQAIVARPNRLDLYLADAEARFRTGIPDPLRRLNDILLARADWVEGQSLRASLRWEMGDAEGFADGFKSALARYPQNAALWNGYISSVAAVGLDLMAADIARDAQRIFNAPVLRLIEAAHAGAAGDLARADAILGALPADTPGRTMIDVRQSLRHGDVALAERRLAIWRDQEPTNLAIWALTDLVWRLLDDPRARWLAGDPRLIATVAIDLGPGEFAALTDLLRGLHHRYTHPAGQSVRGGTQTRGALFDRAEPLIAHFRSRLQVCVDRYFNGLPPFDAAHPLLRNRASTPTVRGGWSVRLTGSGHHVAHLHPAGIVSSACYIVVPDTDDVAMQGWLNLGCAPTDLAISPPPITSIKPEPGNLVLFPSFLYHGTTPFERGERMTVAFDAN